MFSGARPPAAAYWGILLAFFAAYLAVHRLAGWTFPLPWPDEGTFLWQALALARDGTLLAPEVNPERHVMWMPPGYMVLSGLIFKLTGFSFAWARLLSALYLLGAVAAVAAMFRRGSGSLLHPVLCGAFLLSRDFVVMGNLARTETLLLLVACSGFLCLQRGRLTLGLALVSLAPLVHPNGLFFCAGAAGFAAAAWWQTSRQTPGQARLLAPPGADLAVACAAAACWVAYLAYAALHWEGVVSDMGFALTWKTEPGVGEAAFWLRQVAPGALVRWLILAGTLAYGVRHGLEVGALLALAFSLQLLGLTTTSWMYGIHTGLLHLVLTVVCLDTLADALLRTPVRALPRLATAALTVLALAVNYLLGNIEDPRGYPRNMTLEKMQISHTPPYLEEEDLQAVRALLASLEEAGEPVRVSIFPWAEALFFHDLESDTVQFFQPSFYEGEADVGIVHISRHLPNDPPLVPRARVIRRSKDWPVLWSRDGTERWRVRMRAPAPEADAE